MMVQQNLILILLLWCSGAEAPFKILLRWSTASYFIAIIVMKKKELEQVFPQILA